MNASLPVMPTIRVNGAELACRARGQGSPMVLVHGGLSDQRSWDWMMPTLAAKHRVVTYSRRFAAPNAPIAEGGADPLGDHVADLLALIRDGGQTPVHLVGHGRGALVALQVAMVHPRLVRSLALIEPPAQAGGALRQGWLTLRRPLLAHSLRRFGNRVTAPATAAFRRGDDAAALASLGRGLLGPRAFAALAPARMAQMLENIAPERALHLTGPDSALSEAALAKLDLPVLILTGEDSPVIAGRIAARVAQCIRAARCATVHGASHLAHEDKPAATAGAILRFVHTPVSAPQAARNPEFGVSLRSSR
jgi:pimeloyl-ACP methyl ester carboxylesterase